MSADLAQPAQPARPARPAVPAGGGRAAGAARAPAAGSPPPLAVRGLAWLALGAAAGSTLLATAGLAALGPGLRSSWGAAYPLVLLLAVGSGALVLRALLAALLVPRAEGGGPRAAHVRLWLWIHVLAVAVHLFWLQPFDLPSALATVALAGGAFGLAALLLRRRRRPASRLARGADLLLTSLAALALGLELGLRLWVEVRPTPLLAGGDSDARAFLRAWRGQPGDMRMGFPINDRGDYDHPWTGRRPGQRLVVSIADSFCTPPVPHPLHFTTVAERELGRAEVYNMGTSAIGPPEYLYLLEHEALPMLPDAVVVNLFVGNDMHFRMPGRRDVAVLRAALDEDELVLARLVRRLWALAGERARHGGPVGVPLGTVVEGDEPLVTTVEEAHAAFPFTTDPALEEPSFSPEAFLRIELNRAARVCAVDGPPFRELERVLERMLRGAGRVPLLLVLIPDELQVEDELWRTVADAMPDTVLERDRPQRLVRAWCEANDVPLLDLLPLFRAVPPLESGRRHLYHLRDTHWNARGNQLAGQALAEFLRPHLAP